MNEEDNKVTRITVDLSTTVKPIAISEEDAQKKLEKDNKTQAQFKDDSIEEPTQENVTTYNGRQLNDTQAHAIVNMQEVNKSFNQESFNKANVTMDTQTPEERSKQAVIILGIIIAIIVLILLIELPGVIKNLR
ncbi:MAG: hypothetical protein IJS56_04245 [Bacilli bacterium]|nr:hypothetical protein [Bacilli bacterium]